ncbi:unnamed protein product [Clonostachys rosea]|uniref:Cytidyltransferase-like domain-containing protein n=1 Tax=Bionectria ochroleuca TaxID=29856 RepID=A0ABY6UAV7_BIOOC|nr:unnamed protein product [Clonostachys rosea]
MSNPNHLGYWAEMALYGGEALPGTPNVPFNGRNATKPPLIQTGVTRILVYPGSFNPPHRGHLDILNHVFENAGVGSEFQGAIILTAEDKELTEKLSGLPENRLLVPLQQRTAMWQEAVKDYDRYWVWKYGNMEYFRGFIKALRSYLNRKTEIELVALLGPDNFHPNAETVPPYHWDCQNLITSNAGRGATFVGPVMPNPLLKCSKWEHPVADRKAIEYKIQGRMADQDPEEIQQTIDKVVWATQRSFVCETPHCILTYIPCDKPGQQNVSSTEIRVTIASLMEKPSSISEMADILRKVGVLCPEVLAKCIQDKAIQEVAKDCVPGSSG